MHGHSLWPSVRGGGVGGQTGGVGPEQGVDHSDCRLEETVFVPAGFGSETLQWR